jgi:hypothetical protein
VNTALSDPPRISARTWNRITLCAFAANIGNTALDVALGHAYSGPVGLPVGVLAVGTGVVGNYMRLKRRRLDAQAQLAIEAEREAKAQLERKWRASVYWLAFPDPGPGQCPVCGLDDLGELLERDTFLHLTGTPGARVAAYGSVHAHAECAHLVPYDKHYKHTPECQHRLGYHHARPGGNCTACQREKDTDTKDPYPAPEDCTCATCRAVETDARLPVPSAPVVDDSRWREFATVEYQSRYRNGRTAGRYVWTCRFCPASCEASTYEHAESALRDHAKACKTGQFVGAMLAIASNGVSIAHLADDIDARRLASTKNATAPWQDPMDWLMDASRSDNPALRETAWRLIRKMQGDL